MVKHAFLQVLVLLLIAAVVVTACGGQPTETPPPAGETPSGGTIYGEAVVDSIDIAILESFPVQIQVLARGNLPDDCTEIDQVLQERQDQTFTVTITAARPADALCTEALVPFEETFSLDVYGLSAGVYTVDVNGVTGTFELAVDNAPQTEPDASGGSLEVKPPPAVLTIAGQEQFSGIGTHCWTAPEGTEPSVAICADMIGIPTAEGPLAAVSPFVAAFQLEPEEAPVELVLTVIPVTEEDEMERWSDGSRSWPYQPGETYTLPLEREPSIELSLEPGLYVLNLQGWWDAWGDASYGFLVEVQSPSSGLVVDETPIVDAEVDGPGHMEYNDRLGEEILARMRGLWARAAELRLERNNAALAPFDYRLEARFDEEMNQEVYDLFHEGQAEPVALGLSYLWPVSVNASGTNFSLVVEKAPYASLYHVQADGVQPWDDADLSNWLPPGYVGDALAQLSSTGFPTITYQVALDSGRPTADASPVYTGTAVGMGAYMPLRSFTTWDGHWALEVDDHLIIDGQDLGETLGYAAAFGFRLIRGQPFYFFEQGGQVRISYAGETLPNTYDQVFHNQCCEASIHNPLNLGDTVLFHALRDGTWYFVEAGLYDGELPGAARNSEP
jgi:hypothetical protein